MKNNNTKGELVKIIKFGITGGLNTAVDVAVYFILLNAFGINKYIAQPFGYIAGTLNSYIVNRKWTFNSSSKFFSPTLIKFIIVNAVALTVGQIVLWVCSDLIGLDGTDLKRALCKLIVVFFTIVINFTGSRFWVFKNS